MSNTEVCTIAKLEDHIFQFEEVRVVFRAKKDMLVNSYPYRNVVGDANTVLSLNDRIANNYPDLEFEIIDGNGVIQHGRTKKLSALRKSYIN